MVKYAVILTAKVACNMNFQTFPFDSHECILEIKNWIGASYRLVLNSPRIYKIGLNGKQLGGKEVEINSDGSLDYNFQFKALDSTIYHGNSDVDTKYSMAQVKMLFNRTDKSRQKLFVGYHLTTAIFSALSLLSYFLHTDQGNLSRSIDIKTVRSSPQTTVYNETKCYKIAVFELHRTI